MKKLAVTLVVLILLTAAYGFLRFFDDSFPYGRMRETDAVRPHEQPLLVMPGGVVPVQDAEASLRATADLDLISPLAATRSSDPLQGQVLYRNYCQPCHGKNHDGRGTVGQSFHPLPGDLRSGRVQTMADGRLFKEISYGVPGGRQPALATTISIADRWQIIAYLKTLGTRP